MKQLCLVIFLVTLCLPCHAAFGQAPLPDAGEQRPYSLESPWNLPIGPNPAYDQKNDAYIERLNKSGHFGCDPNQYTLPVYIVDEQTPLRKVKLTNFFSDVSGDQCHYLDVLKKVSVDVPIPDQAAPAQGTDSQIILWNPSTGDEWGFWLFQSELGDSYIAENGYHYNTRGNGVPPRGFRSRGAGVPYLAGLIRPWEIKQGRIEHAIAFASEHPALRYVFPATRSDGSTFFPELPMGARLQLDPGLGEKEFREWGLDATGVIIARALQEYGMILIDGSGHPKIYAEYQGTAHWGTLLDPNAVRSIPYTAFRVLDVDQQAPANAPEGLQAAVQPQGVRLDWSADVQGAGRFRVIRRIEGQQGFVLLASELLTPNYLDTTATSGTSYEYGVQAVNWNGVGPAATVSAAMP